MPPLYQKHMTGDGGILIHCWAGVNRSAAILICYLCLESGMPLLDAFSSVQEKRGMILTNWEFRKQLAVAWVKRTKESMQANEVSWQRVHPESSE